MGISLISIKVEHCFRCYRLSFFCEWFPSFAYFYSVVFSNWIFKCSWGIYLILKSAFVHLYISFSLSCFHSLPSLLTTLGRGEFIWCRILGGALTFPLPVVLRELVCHITHPFSIDLWYFWKMVYLVFISIKGLLGLPVQFLLTF